MLIKNYYATQPLSPGLDLQIIEDVTAVLVYAGCQAGLGDLIGANVASVYDNRPETLPQQNAVAQNQPSTYLRHVDFTNKEGTRCRLIVTNHAYICNDRGQTVEKVTA